MPLQFLEVGFHVEIHAIEWHDFERDTQFHGVVVARIEFSQNNNEAPIILQKTSKRSRRLYWQKKTLYMFVYRYLLLCLERQSQVTTLATLP